MVDLQNFYHGTQSRSTRGTTHGGLTSPDLFNVVVESVVPNWMYMIVECNVVIHNGMGHAVGRILGVFYMENGIIG